MNHHLSPWVQTHQVVIFQKQATVNALVIHFSLDKISKAGDLDTHGTASILCSSHSETCTQEP